MNKQELIEKVVKETGATKALAGKVLESAMENIGKTLKKGDTITFVGFGTFKTSVRKARTARNPRTGEPIKIAKRRVPRFTAGKALKDLVK
jgi:DNA-binding protein HU-beta